MDFLLSIGMRPFVELSFMPETLASGGKTVFHYRANVTPPKDHKQWATLIKKLVGHWVERYGLTEVSQWYFEVWNEPNLDAFGTGKTKGLFPALSFYRRSDQQRRIFSRRTIFHRSRFTVALGCLIFTGSPNRSIAPSSYSIAWETSYYRSAVNIRL